MKLNSFDVFAEMVRRGDNRLQAAPLSNISTLRRTKRGTLLTMGVGGDHLQAFAEGRYCGGLILCDAKAHDDVDRELRDRAELTLVSAELVHAARLGGFVDAALEIADTMGMRDGTRIPVWPDGNPSSYPELTVGLLRALERAIAKAEGRS